MSDRSTFAGQMQATGNSNTQGSLVPSHHHSLDKHVEEAVFKTQVQVFISRGPPCRTGHPILSYWKDSLKGHIIQRQIYSCLISYD
jgi:hypothetical protein